MRTSGRGHIQAWPFGTADQLGDIPFVVDEHGLITMDPLLRVWVVECQDGRELVIPVSAAVVVWDPVEKVRPEPELAALFPKRRLTVPEKLSDAPGERPGHYCQTCGQWYLRKLDAYLCQTKDALGGDLFKGGDCQDCGYPKDLHRGVRIEQTGTTTHFEEIRDALGKMKDRIPHEIPVYKATLPESSAPECVLDFPDGFCVVPHTQWRRVAQGVTGR